MNNNRKLILVCFFIVGIITGITLYYVISRSDTIEIDSSKEYSSVSSDSIFYFSYISPAFTMTAQRIQPKDSFLVQISSITQKQCILSSKIADDISEILTFKTLKEIKTASEAEEEFPTYFGVLITANNTAADVFTASFLFLSKDKKSIMQLDNGIRLKTTLSVESLKKLEHLCPYPM